MTLRTWIQKGRELGASDVHLEAGTVPVARVRGELLAIAEALPAAYLEQVAQRLLGAEAWERFIARGSADISMAIGGIRCRINVYQTIRGIAIAVRLLTPAIRLEAEHGSVYFPELGPRRLLLTLASIRT